ncbi:uncharacterized protein L969DRAFT_53007 [Mixia osmundae IAM 14324]|uniref:Cryptochrome DASH n=1 Tax=Mixia osmundae (strain CBS 9802 / IAM 14324 / JCM 22182 / KY 12970) TaxID=764103 RepID=G7DWK7_MIXOS|nr:uncharacterized protein L969DRAFT_53007 [Mixia osmundae IAM 14324]KEI37368.1 hypothetical protein L969DRAFT_53007 [Mixia osmundae IAM 14324]GAA94967.1 hypothetical protein E5Q_01622 [Mixia osmundae IAM 14324]
MTGRSIAIALLRCDLRIHDNAIFHATHYGPTASNITHVLPLYVFDERQIELSGLPDYKRKGPPAKTRVCGFWRSGAFKAKFLTEAVFDVQKRLRSAGSDLAIRFGVPEDATISFIKALQKNGDTVEGIYLQRELCVEEIASENRLMKGASALGVKVHMYDTKALIHPDDLPFKVDKTPDVFTPFRKRVEGLNDKMSRPILKTPNHFKPYPEPLPDSDAYGSQLTDRKREEVLAYILKPLSGTEQHQNIMAQKKDPSLIKSAFPYEGGETAALERLDYYFFQGAPPPAARYKQTRNQLLGHSYSTKLSPFLCIGSISPRLVMKAVDDHEAKFELTQDTYWVRFELLWRDYFLYISRKYGVNLFLLEGFEGVTDPKKAANKVDDWNDWTEEEASHGKLSRWLKGTTGVPFIDANMIELVESGFMSNRGRQNVASFLTKDLYYDWRIGAEYFESHLVDYEPCANYGNWQYVAGVGNDPRASRQFNPIKQSKDYDAHGRYIKHWLPALSKLSASSVHTPWLLSDDERKQFDLTEKLYPSRPVLEQQSWKSHYDRREGQRSKSRGNPNEKIRGKQSSNRGHSRPQQQRGVRTSPDHSSS